MDRDLTPGDLIEFEFELPEIVAVETREGVVRDVTAGVITVKTQLPTRTVVYELDEAAAEDEQVRKQLPDETSLGDFGPLVDVSRR